MSSTDRLQHREPLDRLVCVARSVVFAMLAACFGCGGTVGPAAEPTASPTVPTSPGATATASTTPGATATASTSTSPGATATASRAVIALVPETGRAPILTVLVARSSGLAGEVYDPQEPDADVVVTIVDLTSGEVSRPRSTRLQGDGVPGVTMPGHVWLAAGVPPGHALLVTGTTRDGRTLAAGPVRVAP